MLDGLRSALGDEARLAVDALWRLDEETMLAFGRRLDERKALWLEAPLQPELTEAHVGLARAIETPIAIGESYRTRYELAPLLERDAARRLQPDLGRCGLTEAWEWGRLCQERGLDLVPHISIAMGPQIAAALHLAASAPSCDMAEYNPRVFDVSNRFLRAPMRIEGAAYQLPKGPGLGIEVDEHAVRRAAMGENVR